MNKETIDEMVTIWNELNVGRVVFEFSCGGDSMNDTSIFVYDKDENEIESSELKDYFEDEVYKNVNFYEASDGHYQGEMGQVDITLEEDGDFSYCKSAQSEWSESIDNEILVELNEEEVNFVKSKILNFNGDDGNDITNYKVDCILTDKEEEMVSLIEEKIQDVCSSYEPNVDSDEIQEWFQYTTNEQGKDIEFVGNSLVVTITNSYTNYTDSDN